MKKHIWRFLKEFLFSLFLITAVIGGSVLYFGGILWLVMCGVGGEEVNWWYVAGAVLLFVAGPATLATFIDGSIPPIVPLPQSKLKPKPKPKPPILP